MPGTRGIFRSPTDPPDRLQVGFYSAACPPLHAARDGGDSPEGGFRHRARPLRDAAPDERTKIQPAEKNWLDFHRPNPNRPREIQPVEKTGWISRGRKSNQSKTGWISRSNQSQNWLAGWISRGVTFFFQDPPCRKRRDNVADTTFRDELRQYDMYKTQ